jgi:hypothetical protein
MKRESPSVRALETGREPLKIGRGGSGGKGRGLAFANQILLETDLREAFEPHRILVPDTVILTTEVFDEFVDRHELEYCLELEDDAEIRRAFLGAPLPDGLRSELRKFVTRVQDPIAVRSSSSNEDAYNQPFAGIYLTLFLPNSHPAEEMRLRQLEDAIRLVFASTYSQNAKRYMARYGIPADTEQMAVLLQRVVGMKYENRFYPHLAGVAQGRNYFAIREQRPEDGIGFIVVGLGNRVVEGAEAMRFAPSSPMLRPHFTTTRDILRYSQKKFNALNLEAGNVELTGGAEETLLELDLEVANRDGVLPPFASTYTPSDGSISEGTFRKGILLASFNRVLRGEVFPLPRMLSRMLKCFEASLGAPIDMEFAVLLERRGMHYYADFYILQVRPLVTSAGGKPEILPEEDDPNVLLRCHTVMGHGSRRGIRHIVYIPPDKLDPARQLEMTRVIAGINRRLMERGETFALLGPGRWGSTNRELGMPVTFAQISQAVVIAELNTRRFFVEPSQGTHFFHNITSGNIFYLSVDLGGEDWLNRELLGSLPLVSQEEDVHHYEVPQGLNAAIDGEEGVGYLWVDGGEKAGPQGG